MQIDRATVIKQLFYELFTSRFHEFRNFSNFLNRSDYLKKKYTNSWIYAVRTSIETLQSGCYIRMRRHELLFHEDLIFSNFPRRFLNPNYFFQFELKLFYLFVFDLNLKKPILSQKLVSPFTVWINCFSDLKSFSNSWPSVEF